MLREFVSQEILQRVAGVLPGPDARLRAELAASQMIGVAFVRYLIELDPLASAPVEQLIELLAPVVQRHLADPLPAVPLPADPPPGDPGAN